LTETCGGSHEFAVELLEMFLGEAPAFLAAIENSLDEGNDAVVVSQSHGFKGVCLSIGADELAGHCRELEQVARGGWLQEARAAQVRLIEAWEQLRQALQLELRGVLAAAS
jgi:HPt (histidine-containing phosphotransfer) domain-containing protein